MKFIGIFIKYPYKARGYLKFILRQPHILFHPVAEAVDGVEVRLLITGKPDKMDIPFKGGFYFAAGIKVVHVAIYHGLEHHLRMVWTAPTLLIKFAEVLQFKVVNYRVNHAHKVIFRNVLVKTLGEKKRLFGIVIPKVYLCWHIWALYHKDTKLLWHGKALACESRDFVSFYVHLCGWI